jgi:hypothetical protein
MGSCLFVVLIIVTRWYSSPAAAAAAVVVVVVLSPSSLSLSPQESLTFLFSLIFSTSHYVLITTLGAAHCVGLHPIARRTSQTYHRTPRLSLR